MNFYASYVPQLGGGGGGGGGGIQSINGDATHAQVIAAGSGITVASSGGTTTISNTAAASESFTIWQPDHGTSPTATSPTDTMDVTSSDASVTITGNAATKTLNFQVAGGPFLPLAGGTLTGALNNTSGFYQVNGWDVINAGGAGVGAYAYIGCGDGAIQAYMLFSSVGVTLIGNNAPPNLRIKGNLGVGNSATATTPGTVVKKIEIFDANGTSLGFIPVYNAIT